MRRVMCPPTYFEIKYSINPWMKLGTEVDHELADQQWRRLVDLLRERGDTIEVVEPAPGWPDMTFAGDAGLAWHQRFIPSRFRHAERAGEVQHYERWFSEQGFEICPMPDGVVFEGLGDVVFHKGAAFVGHGYRSAEKAVQHLTRLVPRLRILGQLQTVDERYFHLAMALGFIDDSTVVYYEPAFTPESVRCIRNTIPRAISVSDTDANEYFACNNLVSGRTVIIDNCTPRLRADLANAGYDVATCGMSEFKKSGGSLRCLVLTLM